MEKKKLDALKKKYEGSLVSTAWDIPNFDFISTGSVVFDTSLWWGIPKWRVVEVFWENSCLKTTMAMLTVKDAQSKWIKCLFIDAECSVSLEHIKNLWVDLNELIYVQPDCAENWMRIAKEFIETWEVWLVIIDSVACMTPMIEAEQEIGNAHMWKSARLRNQFLRVITPVLSKTWCVLLLINQIRASMDMFSWVTTTWWKGIAYHASQRIQMLKPKIEWTDVYMRYKIHKNKVRWQLWEWDTLIHMQWWVDVMYDLVTMWCMCGVIEKKGAWYSYNGKDYQWRKSLTDMPTEDIESLKKAIKKLSK